MHQTAALAGILHLRLLHFRSFLQDINIQKSQESHDNILLLRSCVCPFYNLESLCNLGEGKGCPQNLVYICIGSHFHRQRVGPRKRYNHFCTHSWLYPWKRYREHLQHSNQQSWESYLM
ncbi:hypothetical protein V8G54_021947, partial [Vigna mungo]